MLCSKASKHPLGNDSVEVETHPKSLKYIKKMPECSPNEAKIAFWDPLGTFSALSSIQDRTRPKKGRKKSSKMEAFWSSFGPMCAKWELICRTNGQKEHPEGIQDKFCTHLKNIKILIVFDGFWRSRLPSGAQNGGLEGLRGATWGSLGDFGEAFLHFFCA